jgi:hypothetical protein
MFLDSGVTSIRRWGRAYRQAISAALLLSGVILPFPCLQAQTTPSVIRVLVDGKPPLTLDGNALAAMPRASIDTAAVHHEPAARWQGVSLEEILQRAGAPGGEQLRGHGMTTIVRVTAADHYQVVFSLAELDPMLGNKQVILADKQDGHPLAGDGPYRIVVPGDKRPARWIRNVTTIEVANSGTSAP